MKGFLGLTKRNLLIYFKDVQAVIFSMLTSIIVFGLYLLFLKNNYVDMVSRQLGVLAELFQNGEEEMLVNGILLVGIIGSALITVPYNCLQTIVKDKEMKIDYDISATPLRRSQIILSYFVSSTLSAILMTAAVLTIGLGVMSSMGDLYMSGSLIAASYGVAVIGSVSSTAFFMILMLFFKSTSASGAFFGMLSAAAGFVIGAFIPLSQFSDGVQTVCNLFPASHVTVLLRNTLLNGQLDHMNEVINGLDGGAFVDAMKDAFSFKPMLFGSELEIGTMLIYIGAVTVVCVGVMVVVYNKTYKRK